MKCTTGEHHRRRDHRRGQAVAPLHHRSATAGQGHRPDRRGRQPHPHGDRLKPEELDRLDRRLIQLKIEREALKKEDDEATRKRLAKLEEDIVKLEREYADLEEI